jgi:two-component system LytT family response regulator
MMKNEITAIIVEDIKEYHQVIENFVGEVAPNVRIVGNAYTLKEAEKLIKDSSPMLLFLDIQFEAEGQTAFDLLKKFSKLDEYNFQVIITTAHDEQKYYAEAFNFGAIHFLTKPIDKQKLKEAITRVSNAIPKSQHNDWISHFEQFHNELHVPKLTERIILEGLNFNEVINTNDIVYLEASGRYTYFYLYNSESKTICSTNNIGIYEKKLQGNSNFFRIHRNKIINLNYVLRFSKKDFSFVMSPPFEKQYASKDRFREFMTQLGNEFDLI